MSPLDTPIESVAADDVPEHLRRIKQFLLTTVNPNGASADGRTCLLWALALCVGDDGERIVTSLLDRGADPNLPSPIATFSTFMTAAKSSALLTRLIEAGLKLDGVYAIEPGHLPSGRGGPITVLNYALDVDAALNRRKTRGLSKLASKHGAPLGGRRRFVAEVISILSAHGARCTT